MCTGLERIWKEEGSGTTRTWWSARVLGLLPGFVIYLLCGLGKINNLSVFQPLDLHGGVVTMSLCCLTGLCGSVCVIQQHLVQYRGNGGLA